MQFYSYGYKSAIDAIDTKTYRRIIDRPLEDSIYMEQGDMASIPIYIGKRINYKNKGFLDSLTSSDLPHKNVGQFRGDVEILEDEILNRVLALRLTDREKKIYGLPRSVEEFYMTERDKEFIVQRDVSLFLYVLEGSYYDNLDIMSENDTYMKVSFGTMKYRSRSIDDRNHPKYFNVFRFDSKFPGPAILKIEFWDNDVGKPDELIGETSIDVEARFFDPVWRSYREKPIEKRSIINPSSDIPVGDVKLWIDIVSADDLINRNYAASYISPKPAENLEVRVIVWDVLNMPDPEGKTQIDLFVTCTLPKYNDTQKTDVHKGSSDGNGSFNYRMVFPIKVDEYSKPEDFLVYFQIFDENFMSDEYLADATVDFSELVDEVVETQERSNMRGVGTDLKEYESTTFKVYPQFRPDGYLSKKFKGKSPVVLTVSVEVLTEREALEMPAGKG